MVSGAGQIKDLVWRSGVLAWPDRLTEVTSWHSHIPFGYWCIEALRPRVVVELGTHKGDSYCALCEAVERVGLGTACYAVDTWAGDHEAGCHLEDVFQELRAYHDPRYGRFSRLVRATFDEALDHFPDGSIDLLHIDGLHTYEAVRHDFETWLPKLSPLAVVLFHDINVREKDFGVWRYWQEISFRFPHFAFSHGHGLGVLLAGEEVPETARILANSGKEQAEWIRGFFARLGQGILAVSALRASESRANALEGSLTEIERLRTELAEGAAEEQRLRTELAEGAAEEQRLRAELAKRAGEVSRLHAVIADLRTLVTPGPRKPSRLPGLDRLRRMAAFRFPRPLAFWYQNRLVASSGMFNAAWYLERYPDVAATRNDPLRHYLRHGAHEGRDPHPFFSTKWYLSNNPDVAASGVNPLVHYVLCGAGEGRTTCPAPGNSSHPTLAPAVPPGDAGRAGRGRYRVNEQSLLRPGVSVRSGRPPVICVTHVTPWPRRAGNEYRTGRLLDWLVAEGYPVVVVLAPLPGDDVLNGGFPAVAARYGNAVMCQGNGRVEARFTSVNASLRTLDDVAVPSPEQGGRGGNAGRSALEQIERSFCHDALVGVLLELERSIGPVIWFVNYIFMTRFLPLTTNQSPSFVDTIDVFSSKRDKVIRYGISDDLAIAPEDEARLLRRANAVVAIQAREAEVLKALVPDRPVITAGVDFDFETAPSSPAAAPTVLCVASDNALNAKGLQDFLRFSWPLITREVPNARLVVAGKVGRFVEHDDPRIEVRGVVDDLAALYRETWVVINPAVAGTGLKIKTMEALSHFCPTVTWPHGVEGVPEALLRFCSVGEDWFDFARKTADILKGEPRPVIDSQERDRLCGAFAAHAVYGGLEAWLAQALRRVGKEGGAKNGA